MNESPIFFWERDEQRLKGTKLQKNRLGRMLSPAEFCGVSISVLHTTRLAPSPKLSISLHISQRRPALEKLA